MAIIREKARKIKHWAREFWIAHYEDIVSGALVFLLVSLAFGAGVVLGSKMFEDSAISVNCPASFWQKN